jgi:hypothetical protein
MGIFRACHGIDVTLAIFVFNGTNGFSGEMVFGGKEEYSFLGDYGWMWG